MATTRNDSPETDGVDSPAMGAGARLKGTVAELDVLLDELVAADMAALGLTSGEADVLTVVHVARHDPVPSEIAEWLTLTGAGVTGRLKTLERRGLLERRPNPTDGRSVTVHLTKAGRPLAAAVLKEKDRAVTEALVDVLGADVVDALSDQLDAAISAARTALGTPK
jgi:DNA-binding MarR family transcriptional regulator